MEASQKSAMNLANGVAGTIMTNGGYGTKHAIIMIITTVIESEQKGYQAEWSYKNHNK